MINLLYNFSFLPMFEVKKLEYLKHIFDLLANIQFTDAQHFVFSIITSILAFIMSVRFAHSFMKKKEGRMLIVAIGFAIGGIFQLLHYFSSNANNIQFFYIFFENFSYAGSILISLFITKNIRFQKVFPIISIFYFIFIIALRYFISPEIIEKSISYATIEIIYAALYFLLALVYFEIRLKNKLNPISPTVIGLLCLSLSELYILTPTYLQSAFRFILHIENILGLLLIYWGYKDLILSKVPLNSRIKLLIFSSITLLISYWILIMGGLILFDIKFSMFFKYYFFAFFIITILMLYMLSMNFVEKVIQPLKSIKTTFIMATLIIITNILVFQSFLSLYSFKNYTDNEAQKHIIAQIEYESNKLYSEIINVENISKITANAIKKYDAKSLESIMISNIKLTPFIFGNGIWLKPYHYKTDIQYYGPYWFRDKDKKIKLTWIYSTPQYNYLNQDWYKEGIISHSKPVWSYPFLDNITNVPMMTVATPLYKAKKLTGIYSIDVSLSSFQNYVSHIKIGSNGYAFIVSDDGVYISNRDNNKIFKEKITEDANNNIKEIGNKIIHANRTEYSKTVLNQDDYIYFYTPIGNTKLKMVFVLPVSDCYNSFNKTIMLNIILFIFTLISFSIIFTWIFSKTIGKPLDNLVKTVKNIAKGDFSVRAHSGSQDEIGILADSLNYMIDSLDKLVKKEKLQHEIISATRSSLNISKVKNKIVTNIGKAVNADRCFIMEFDQVNNKFLPIEHEYLINSNLRSNLGFDIEAIAPELAKKAKEINVLIVSERDQFIEENNLQNTPSAKYLINANIKSAFVIRLTYSNIFFGILVVHFQKVTNPLNEDDMEFVKSLAAQMGIALYQSKLFENSRFQANREALIRKITEAIRSSLDIEEVLNIICSEIARLLNIQRVTIVNFPNQSDLTDEFVIKREFRVSEDIKGLFNTEHDKRAVKHFVKSLIDKDIFIIDNIDEYDGPEYFTNTYKHFGVKSLVGVPVKKDNLDTKILLILSEYNYYRKWSDDEINLIKTMCDQIYIALQHAELYAQLKKHAEREALVRKIIETIRSSLDINETLKIICEEVALIFNVDRASIGEFINKNKTQSWLLRREFKSREDIKGSNDFSFDANSKAFLNDNISNNKIFTINNISNSDIPDFLKNVYEPACVKSIITASISKGNYVWGGLILADYNEYRNWTNEEKELLLTISDQIYIAIEQAQLYTTQKKQAEREILLRTISNDISKSMDINIIKHRILTEVGRIFNADRVAIVEYYEENNELVLDESFIEYLSSDDVISLKTLFPKLDTVRHTTDKLRNAESIIFNDYEEYINTNNLNNTIVERNLIEYSIKSCICVPIFNNDKYFGSLLIHFTKEKSDFDDNDIEFIKTLAKQTGIALHQFILFENLKQTIKNEKTLAHIMSTIKSNLNIDEVMMIICNELINLFNIKKVCIQEFNQLTRSIIIYKTTDPELKGKCSPDYDLETKDLLFDVLIEKGQILNIEDVKNSNLPNKEFYMSKNINSIIGIPLKIANNVWGALFLYDNKKRKWKHQDINLAKTIAEYISLAIKNIYLYTQEEFLANVSHELKTPIAIINGYTEVLIDRDKNKSEMSEKFLPIIKNNTERINAIVENILYISKLNKSIEVEHTDFKRAELRKIIEEVILNLKETAKVKSIDINFNYNGPLYANINEFLIYQAITNLLINAINYSDNNTVITINAYKQDNMAKIAIQDQGCGIPEEHLPYIFERFYRVDKSRSRETGGTGLGLSIVKNIMDIHSGQIRVTSEYGKGSIFTIVLNSHE